MFLGSKRPLQTSSQETDDELDELEESKRPKLDIIEPEIVSQRRRKFRMLIYLSLYINLHWPNQLINHYYSMTGSAESTGARERSKPPERMSLKGIANKAGVTGPLTPNEKKLAVAAQEYRQIAHRFRRNLTISQRKNGNLAKLAKPKFIDMVDEMCINKVTKNLVKAEMRNFKKKPNGRTWNTSDKLFALSIYKRSARAYRFMREYILLPSESTLKSMLDNVPIKPGISDVFLSMLKHKLTTMSAAEKVCIISFDEMFLRGSLYHHHGHNIIDGFEDYGHRGRTNRIADHALVFMAQGLETKWVMPVAYFLVSKTCPSSMLKLLIQDVVSKLISIGLTVVGSVSDQGSNNRGAIGELRKESGDSIFYNVGQTRLVHIWDMPHILKNVRNNLLSSDVEYKPGKIAKWRHLIEYFKLDETLYGLSTLTYRHLNPTGRDKMRVILAAQVLSTNVSLSIKNAYHLSNGSRLGQCLPFAEFCGEVDTYFDLCNGPRKGEKVKENRVDVTAASVHHTMWDKMLNSMQQWVFIRKSDGARHVPFCIKGWIENIKSFRMLWRKVQAAGLDILRLRHVNQDPVENLFCLIRQCGGSSTDITVKQFIAALKTCLITRFASPVKDKNCIDDDSYFLNTLQPLLNLMPHEEHQLPQQTSLVRGDTLDFNEAGATAELQTTHLLTSVMSGLSKDVKCDSCLSLLTSAQPSQNALFALNSTLTTFPSSVLLACFIEARKLFESKFKEILHKSEVVAEVVKACDCAIRYQSLLCPDHQEDSINRGLISEKIAEVLIKSKVAFCNSKFKEKVVRRTRQADAKTSHGLRQSEEEEELSQSDVQLLLGAQPGAWFVVLYQIWWKWLMCSSENFLAWSLPGSPSQLHNIIVFHFSPLLCPLKNMNHHLYNL